MGLIGFNTKFLFGFFRDCYGSHGRLWIGQVSLMMKLLPGEKALKDPLKSHKPELPMTGPSFEEELQGGMIKETWMDEDPRKAILKHADAAAKDPKFIAPAYAETRTELVFMKSDSEEE
ncbi:hypothetical protein IFM89_018866 [Coptis chinensis]|uniref:Uncharacterized protein n=1 Tax=Coptis chinensis TaxID=261450 RepID=A0A835M053_9MAGN|nr:hypothetical protein IFM89_018866 [Coptis chinensis]